MAPISWQVFSSARIPEWHLWLLKPAADHLFTCGRAPQGQTLLGDVSLPGSLTWWV